MHFFYELYMLPRSLLILFSQGNKRLHKIEQDKIFNHTYGKLGDLRKYPLSPYIVMVISATTVYRNEKFYQ